MAQKGRRTQLTQELARRYQERLEVDGKDVEADPRRSQEELYFFVKERFER